MNWLTNLLGIEAPEGMTLTSAELGFRGLTSFWPTGLLLTLGGVVILVGMILFYFLERGKIDPFRRILLGVLRAGLLILLILLLFRPILLAEFEGQRTRSIVLLLDNSQSMTQKDKRMTAADKLRVALAKGLVSPDTSLDKSAILATIPEDLPTDPARIEMVSAVLTNEKLDLFPNLEKKGPLRSFLFGTRVQSVVEKQQKDQETAKELEKDPRIKELLKKLDGKQPRTGLADSIMEILNRKGGDLPAGMVVMTDGRDNASKFRLIEAAEECERFGVPLYLYGVGSTESGILELREVNVADTIFYDDTVSVPLQWRARGFKKGTIQAKIYLGDKQEPVAEEEFPLKLGEEIREVLTFTPKKKKYPKAGKLPLRAVISLKDNDQFTSKKERLTRLSDNKVKILYIENYPRWEYKFLQSVLLRDRRVEASFILVKGDRRLMESGPPFLPSFPKREDLLKFDLIILGDVPARYFGNQKMKLIQEFVREFRGGLIMIAGRRNAPASYIGTPLAEVLPVEVLPAKFQITTGERTKSYKPELTQAGESLDMLRLAPDLKDNLKVWKKLPGWYWHYPVEKLRPAAIALLTHPIAKMKDEPMPVMAMQFYGKGQVLFMASDETWRWRYNEEEKYFTRFWGQVIYRFALAHLLGESSSRSQFALERSEALVNRPGSIYARLLDKEFRPLKKEEVEATLVEFDKKGNRESTRKVTLQSITGRKGEYQVFLEHDRKGNFELRIPGFDNTYQYEVKLPPKHELEESGLDESALREAARVSGGKYYREEDLHHLVEDIQEKKNTFTLRQEILLWNPLVFVLFLVLISAEWIIRKFSNLS